MENNAFEYTYSPQRQQEVEEIRRQYFPKEEDKLAELIIADYERKISNAKICVRNGELSVVCI